jgi:hypothetical protein
LSSVERVGGSASIYEIAANLATLQRTQALVDLVARQTISGVDAALA